MLIENANTNSNSNSKTKLKMVDAHSCYFEKRPCGEDAHFISPEKQVIGVADGVGFWRKRGIDSGEYARELLKNVKEYIDKFQPDAVYPKLVIFVSHYNTKKPGSSTVCLVALNGNRLHAANLGDSGFLVIRGGKTIYRSPIQQHRFNAPYALSQSGLISPLKAEEMQVEMESGDVIVVATDGLFDNVFPDEIEATVERCLKDGKRVEIAHKLAKAARRNYRKSETDSPFAKAAQEAGLNITGGKRDDITVAVAFVEEDLENSNEIIAIPFFYT